MANRSPGIAPTPTWIPGDDDYWRDGFTNRPLAGNDSSFEDVGNDANYDAVEDKQSPAEEKKHDDEQKR